MGPSPEPAKRLRRLAVEQRGLSIAEVMIAALILLIASLGVLGLVDASTRNTFRAEQSQVANNVLQEQIEQVKQVQYEQLGLTSMPSSSSDPANPNSRVSGSSFELSRTGPSNPAALVSGGSIDPGPTPFTSGDVTGNIYRYVVWQNDPACSDAQCPGQQDYKLLVVSTTINTTASGGTRRYQEIQGAVPDPARTLACPAGGCPPGGGSNLKPWTFWMTDTPCVFDTRQPITSDHLAHNTRGTCAQGLKNSSNCDSTSCPPGAPDLMYTVPSPLDNTYPDDQQPLYDYSTDTGSEKGLKLQNGGSCNTLNTLVGQIAGLGGLNNIIDLLGSNNFKQVHKWLSPQIPSGHDILLNGDGTLNLWTKTATGGSYGGKLCFWLFYRHTVLGLPVDTPMLFDNGSGGFSLNNYTYTDSTWPTDWEELHIPLSFQLGIHLLPGAQLGVAIGVDGTATGAGGLRFLYDAPSFDSRLELKTSSILPIF